MLAWQKTCLLLHDGRRARNAMAVQRGIDGVARALEEGSGDALSTGSDCCSILTAQLLHQLGKLGSQVRTCKCMFQLQSCFVPHNIAHAARVQHTCIHMALCFQKEVYHQSTACDAVARVIHSCNLSSTKYTEAT